MTVAAGNGLARRPFRGLLTFLSHFMEIFSEILAVKQAPGRDRAENARNHISTAAKNCHSAGFISATLPSKHSQGPTSSLLAEIESAYYELELKRQQKAQTTNASQQSAETMTSEELVQPPPSQHEQCHLLSASSSDTILEKSHIDSQDNREQTTSEGKLLAPESAERTVRFQKSSSQDTSDAPSTSYISDTREASNPPQADPEDSLNPELSQEVLEEDSSSESLSLESRSLYTSRLPEPQPLYQIYMQQEQEKLFLETDPRPSVSKAATEFPVNVTPDRRPADVRQTSGPEMPEGLRAATSEPAAVSKPIIVAQNPTIVHPSMNEIHDDHEADSVCGSCGNGEGSDDIESGVCIRRQSSSASTDSGRGADTASHITSSNTSMRRERLTAGSMCGSQRSLWCELAEVKSAGLLEQLDEHSKKLQEAYFEVITSEASYLRSINILITHFMAAPELMGSKSASSVITNAERKQLFSNIQAIRDASEGFLCDLESRLKENLLLSDVCDILCEHFEKYFDAYVKYCSNQVYQDRTLKRLKASNSQFLTCVQKIESDKQCQGLDMRSFLMLPMQRITRYPLLVYAILDRQLDPTARQHTHAARALILANQVVRNCNEGARRMERTEQLLEIERRMIYKAADLKRIPLVTSGRYVVKSGLITQVIEKRSKGKINMLQSKQKTRSVYLFLFSDLLLIAKKKLNGTFVCKDYAPRRFIVIEPVEPHNHKVPAGAVSALPGKPHLFFCILLQNARGKQMELLLNAESESDRERWLSAMRPPTTANPDEKIYAEWDCPQAIAVHTYEASQEDELSLENGDLVNILRKMPDGWFYGERTRDGKGGWFPSSYVQQVLNDHVRANNYRHRLRVIQAAVDYRLQHHPNHQHNHRPMSSIGEKRASSFASTGSTTLSSNTSGNTSGLSSSVTSSASFNHSLSSSTLGVRSQDMLMSRLRRLSNPKAFFATSSPQSID
ncbi:rhoGEF domain-containing protein [Ditylenchus destructor]|uniref:RhoGEF domain-containing protein n=1 Tax=Ditylenchus destructor TaxID=166010 RepID=A0AAD4R3D8_9BILA|nr:rhoGEF domain-containing protein [Ditylenchus destructor]